MRDNVKEETRDDRVEDAFHEVVLHLLEDERYREVDPSGNVRGYLFMCVENELKDQHDKAETRQAYADQAQRQTAGDATAGVEARQRHRAFLASLPLQQRRVAELQVAVCADGALYETGCTQREIAAMLGISEPAVSKHMKKIRVDWVKFSASESYKIY